MIAQKVAEIQHGKHLVKIRGKGKQVQTGSTPKRVSLKMKKENEVAKKQSVNEMKYVYDPWNYQPPVVKKVRKIVRKKAL